MGNGVCKWQLWVRVLVLALVLVVVLVQCGVKSQIFSADGNKPEGAACLWTSSNSFSVGSNQLFDVVGEPIRTRAGLRAALIRHHVSSR